MEERTNASRQDSQTRPPLGKSNKLSSELGQYTFEVHGHANKHQIAQAVEETFKVTVRRVKR
jgi:ribosomal protein L23